MHLHNSVRTERALESGGVGGGEGGRGGGGGGGVGKTEAAGVHTLKKIQLNIFRDVP